ncbi:TlpA disulfide reductase family protein [Winogradskyella arenosi]|uniref:Peroxiredoxin n=1 Tax=Winogradskyella arenosi TaxID=533325 RepID=A0A368ZG30_9FLAO|nr:TlpA disulfide reductase family protein [Winogradskyella arenosi]RCW92403.1 peroxiredoxin [Winogradskyella arenosi]
MKKILTLTLISLLFVACKTEPKRTDYLIDATAKGVYNGVRAYLKIKQQNGRSRVIDTAIVVDEKFSFTGKVMTPSLSLISINSVKGDLNFMLENKHITVEVNKDDIAASIVTGSESHADYKAYQKQILELVEEAKQLKQQLRDRSIRDSISKLYVVAQQKRAEAPLKFIENHSSSFYSLSLIEQGIGKNNVDIERYMAAYELLDSEIKNSPKGVSVKIGLDKLMADFLKTAQVNVGKIAPNFEAPNPKGKMVSLEEVKGKVTIIDFWASWCAPCRRENPNVVNVYNKYHSQGLEIIGVSLDGSRNQRDPKKAWMTAVKQDQLTWTHVSSLKYFQDPVAQLYNINAIPATFILDKHGRIAAKNLRGKALELKVQELLKL